MVCGRGIILKLVYFGAVSLNKGLSGLTIATFAHCTLDICT